MQRGGSRNSHSKNDTLKAGFLHAQLSNADLIKKLKVVTETLEEYGDEDEEIEKAKSETFHISSCLGEDWLLEHKNKDVRLLVACALADILRIFAPEPPYEEETNADVIKLFIKILRGFQSPEMTPQHPSYSIHFYLLERLSNISIFSIIPELETFRDELLKMLVQAAYDIAGDIAIHHATSKVTDHLTSIICSVIEDMAMLANGIPVELLDLMVCSLCQEEKKNNPNGFAMMRKVIASCPNNFQPFLERQLHQVKTGIQLDSDLTNKDRLAEAVFELSTAAPKCLTGVLGAYAEDLQIEDAELRIKAVKLLGAVFAVGNYNSDFSQAFAEFKRRSVDKDPDVRKALVNVMQAMVTKRPEMGKLLMEDEWNYMGGSREAPLLKLVIDPDEGVRKDAVSAVLSACLVNADSVPQGIVEFTSERVLDKKPSVRKQAMEGLAMLWQKYCAPFDASRLPKNVGDRFGWIPSKILMLQTAEMRTLVLHCMEDICLKPLNDERSTSEVALDFFSSLDDKAKDNLILLLKQRGRFCEYFVKFCELRDQETTDMEVHDGDKSEAQMLQRLSHFFPDPGSAHDQIQKLHVIKGQVGTKVWQLLENLVKEPAGSADTMKVQDEILKRLGPKHAQLAFVKILISKLSDRCFGVDFIRLVLNSVVEDEAGLGAAAKQSLALIPQLANFNKNFVTGEEDALEALLTSRCNDPAVCQSVLKTISVAGAQMPALCKSKDAIATVKDLCMHESWIVAKYAVRALIALGHDDMGTLSKVAQDASGHVSFGNKLPSALRVLSEVAKAHPEAVDKEKENVSKFVRRRLLQGAWPASAGKKDRHVVIDSKVQGLKLLTVFAVQEDDANSMASLELFEEIISNGGEIQSGDNSTSKADKVILRKTAGSCILKYAKGANAHVQVTPSIFATLSRLFEDEERVVKEAIMNKLYKGTAVEQGKLPFRFACLFALVVHDTDSAVVERGKLQLRNTLMVMSKLKKQCGSEKICIMCEHIIPWLIYLLVVHHEYADPDEDATQASIAFKKYFELFFACVPNEDQNLTAMQQLLHYIRKSVIPSEAAAKVPAKVIERNIGLATEVAERSLLNKRWATKGFHPSSLPKIVDASIFCEKGKATQKEEQGSLGFSPSKVASSSNSVVSKRAPKQSRQSAASDLVSPVKSPAKCRPSSANSNEPYGMHIDDDSGASAFKFEDESKPKTPDLEKEHERGRRTASLGSAPRSNKVASSGADKSTQGRKSQARVLQQGDTLEFEMAEPTVPGGVEWLPGMVLSVNAKKKNFKVVIKNDEHDESTWNEETYTFADEGVEWRWPSEVASSAPKARKSSGAATPTGMAAKPVKAAPPSKAPPTAKPSKPSSASKSTLKAASPRVVQAERSTESVGTSGKKTPPTKRKESPSVTPSNAFDDFDDVGDGQGADALPVSKKDTPMRDFSRAKSPAPGSKATGIAKARASAVIAKARESAVVGSCHAGQDPWVQALAHEDTESPSKRQVGKVKRRRI